ncbi:MAG TPA: MG2 domain-containing protein, partial [Gemmataceae bacterium]|nr:MG2 domain-containing protein [Gemmataceae bacterium]
MTCDHYRDLLWDDLYGLLEASESEALRGHVASCPTCQIELQKAETGQRLLSKAALLDEVLIPPFTMPAPAAATATLSLTTVNHQPALARRRLLVLPWLAAAAAALVLILLPYGFYQRGLSQREAAYRSSEHELQTVLAERQTSRQQADDDLKAAEAAARVGQLRVQVLGPPAYQPGGLNQYHVQATDLSGARVGATVRARLLDDRKQVLFDKEFKNKNDLVVTLPGDLTLAPNAAGRLEFIATGPNAEALVQEQIPVLGPKYVTQLVLDKAVYHPGETIFFRTLTLDRFTHKPPARPLELAYKLYDPKSMTRTYPQGTTRPDGSGSGEFDLAPNAISGEYKLNVPELKNVFASVTRSIWVQPAGDKTVRPLGSEGTPEKRTIDFFPEGGDLVVGLTSRVYFRVHGLGNQAAAVKGQVIDGQGRSIAEVQTTPSSGANGSAFGMFSFTPQPGESYRLRIGGAGEPLTVGLPAARSEGIVLSAPTAVIKEGDALRLLLAATAERPLLIGVSCRGNLVAQEAVTARPGVQEVVLHPAAAASGLLRATVFEVQANRLQPLAERLVYRLPAERLTLSVTTDKKQYRPGDKVQLTVRSDNEKAQPQSAWLSVSVVDQDAWSQARGHSGPTLPAYFQLAAGLDRPEDVEQANLPLDDDPQSRAALDFFLA